MAEILATTNHTPIEIALGVDENGMTTARKLFEFLEMDKSHFARWSKKNIEKNEFYEKNTDWWGFATVANGNECMDYKLTTDFAKHLSMESHSAKGKNARDYFVAVENKAKVTALRIQELSPELRSMVYSELKLKEQLARLDKIEITMKGIVDSQPLSGKQLNQISSSITKRLKAIKRNHGLTFNRKQSRELRNSFTLAIRGNFNLNHINDSRQNQYEGMLKYIADWEPKRETITAISQFELF